MAKIVIDTDGNWFDQNTANDMRKELLFIFETHPQTHTLSGLARYIGVERQCAKRRLIALGIYKDFKRLQKGKK